MNRAYTNREKRQAVWLLLTHPKWRLRSNREIAQRCGVSHDLVNRLRKELNKTGSNGQPPDPTGTPKAQS